jgi:hypothetical protein
MPAIIPYIPNVTRIPVRGPAPFNVLVCISMTVVHPSDPDGVIVQNDGNLVRFGGTVATPFILAGADPRVAPPFQHSTTLALAQIGPAPNNDFVYAVDSLTDAGFDKITHAWTVSWSAALAATGSLPAELCVQWTTVTDANGNTQQECIAAELPFALQVMSYVLCYEPPLPNPPPPPPDPLTHFGTQRKLLSHKARSAWTNLNARATHSRSTPGPAGTQIANLTDRKGTGKR